MDVLRRDPAMAGLIKEHGELTLEPADDMFERLIVSVVNQQLSSASAAAIRDRMFQRFDITPDGLAAADEEALRDVGLSGQKTEYVQNVARAFQQNGFSLEYFEEMSDDEVIDELTQIKGIGVWTGKMFLMFCLARSDVFPVEDLGVRRGMTVLYDIEDRGAMIEKAEDWRPYRSHASLYLWRVTD